MTKNKVVLVGKKSLRVYLILAALFVLIFGGITILGFFISRISLTIVSLQSTGFLKVHPELESVCTKNV